MKAKRRTGYGVFDLTRQVARRIQQEWENVESPPRLHMRPLGAVESTQPKHPPAKSEKQPLAA